MYPLLFSLSLLGPHSLGIAISILHFLYLAMPLKCWPCLIYFPALCGYIVHDVYIYICLHVCGWLCTFYDGLLWLRESPSLVMRALDLVVWVCAKGNCCKCIFMLYCDCLDPCHQVTLVSPCMRHASTCLTLWRALARHGVSMLIRVIYTNAKPC